MEITFLNDYVNTEVKMNQIKDIVDRILDDAEHDRKEITIADTASEVVVIDIDEILDIFGAPMVYHEIVSKSKGLGSLSFIYTRLAHPVIAALFNSGVSEDQEQTEKFLRRLAYTRTDDDIGNYIYDNLEARIWELSQVEDNMVNIRTKELMRLCISIVELVVVRIRDYALEFNKTVPPLGNVKAAIQIDQRCTAFAVPEENPDSLVITLNYGWVYL